MRSPTVLPSGLGIRDVCLCRYDGAARDDDEALARIDADARGQASGITGGQIGADYRHVTVVELPHFGTARIAAGDPEFMCGLAEPPAEVGRCVGVPFRIHLYRHFV